MTNKASIKLMLVLLSAIVVFHLTLMLKIVPYNIAWGGQIKTDEAMYVFESISIMINSFLAFILLIKGGYLKVPFWEKKANAVLWVFLVIFILNTVGNIFAKTDFEKTFAIVTLLFALLIAKLLRTEKEAAF